MNGYAPRGVKLVNIAVYTLMSSLTALGVFAQSRTAAPQTEISNGGVRASIYLPNVEKGFYRGTRFDWSGVIGDLEYQGHRYYGPWFTRTDPSVHDFIYDGADIVAGPCSAITGPVEEFSAPLGYEEAKAGGTFVKIGVGVLQKPDDAKYDSYHLYKIVDPGKWSVHRTATSVEFTQTVRDPSTGYAYLYRKTVRLLNGKAGMVIEHSLKNLGTRPIQTRVYDHNFLVLDGKAPGPGMSITLPFQIVSSHPPDKSLAEIRGNQIVYLKTLVGEDRVQTPIGGFSQSPEDYNIRIENAQAKAGMTISGDHPLVHMNLWSIRSVLAVEPFIGISVEPGGEMSWKYEYGFYTLGHPSQQ